MAKGGPGGFDVNALMKQAQQMQAQMLETQEKLKDETVEASAGGGMVKVTMGGDLSLRSITIDPEAVDPEDVELLQEMVQAAVNEGAARGAGPGRLENGGRDRRAGRWPRRDARRLSTRRSQEGRA